MQYLKFSFIFFLIITNVTSQDELKGYSIDDCLNVNFDIKVKHATLPFGLLPMSVNVRKQSCVIDLELVQYFIWKDKWRIDVCRDPIHLKIGRSLDEVLKKTMNCNFQSKNNPFCQELRELSELIEDNLLVYANGEKENLDSDHGKSYCSFELIKKYLNKNNIYSRYKNDSYQHKFSTSSSKGNSTHNETAEQIVPKKRTVLKKKETSEIIKEASNPEIKLEETTPVEIKIPTDKIEI